jgi:hypothetical protein
MAVFDQFKNLIRHGKAAKEGGSRSFGNEVSKFACASKEGAALLDGAGGFCLTMAALEMCC